MSQSAIDNVVGKVTEEVKTEIISILDSGLKEAETIVSNATKESEDELLCGIPRWCSCVLYGEVLCNEQRLCKVCCKERRTHGKQTRTERGWFGGYFHRKDVYEVSWFKVAIRKTLGQ